MKTQDQSPKSGESAALPTAPKGNMGNIRAPTPQEWAEILAEDRAKDRANREPHPVIYLPND